MRYALFSAILGQGTILKVLQRLGRSSSPLTLFPLLSFNVCSGVPTATVPVGALKDACGSGHSVTSKQAPEAQLFL